MVIVVRVIEKNVGVSLGRRENRVHFHATLGTRVARESERVLCAGDLDNQENLQEDRNPKAPARRKQQKRPMAQTKLKVNSQSNHRKHQATLFHRYVYNRTAGLAGTVVDYLIMSIVESKKPSPCDPPRVSSLCSNRSNQAMTPLNFLLTSLLHRGDFSTALLTWMAEFLTLSKVGNLMTALVG